MGGIDIRVPRELTVVSEGTAFLGGVDFLQESAGGIISGRKAEYNGDPSSRKKLIIRALAVLGGIEVKH
jgi:predicted membrane protein